MITSVFFVGPLPPPVHGFSKVNQHMLDLLKNRCTVFAFDVNPRLGFRSYLFNFLIFIFKAFKIKERKVMYLALSGGLRQWIDLIYILLAKTLSLEIYVHHHSFAYLNSSPLISRICMKFLSKERHIVLCDVMGDRLALLYGIDQRMIHVISNSAFVEKPFVSTKLMKKNNALFRIGFLSNITKAKGIFDFFDLMDTLSTRGLMVEGVIAGPLDSAIENDFQLRLSCLPTVKHIGPVYNEEKISFFSELDLLVFPTRYVNEAEPVTIHEALSFGVPIVAVERGCIACMLPKEIGVTVADIHDFVDVAIKEISRLIKDPAYETKRHNESLTYFSMQRMEHVKKLDLLLMKICNSAIR